MPDTPTLMDPPEVFDAGRCQGVNHVLAWLQGRGLDWLAVEYLEEGRKAQPPAPPPPYVPKIVSLPGAPPSPAVVLARTISKIDHIESVAVIIKWRAGSFDLDWSLQRTADLAYGALIVQEAALAGHRERSRGG